MKFRQPTLKQEVGPRKTTTYKWLNYWLIAKLRCLKSTMKAQQMRHWRRIVLIPTGLQNNPRKPNGIDWKCTGGSKKRKGGGVVIKMLRMILLTSEWHLGWTDREQLGRLRKYSELQKGISKTYLSSFFWNSRLKIHETKWDTYWHERPTNLVHLLLYVSYSHSLARLTPTGDH